MSSFLLFKTNQKPKQSNKILHQIHSDSESQDSGQKRKDT